MRQGPEYVFFASYRTDPAVGDGQELWSGLRDGTQRATRRVLSELGASGTAPPTAVHAGLDSAQGEAAATGADRAAPGLVLLVAGAFAVALAVVRTSAFRRS